MNASDVEKALRAQVVPGKNIILGRFFKTGPGQYGEGDVFIGVMVPQQRAIAKTCGDMTFSEIEKLLLNKIHEFRLTALLILVYQYESAVKNKNLLKQKEIYNFYIEHLAYINNWDLVDVTAPNIVGSYLKNNKSSIKLLYTYAKSDNLWKRRIAIISTFTFIRNNDFEDTLKISEMLLDDKHDLMHKAVGWMLREVGKRDRKVLLKFLDSHSKQMPRTMLRYAIEHLDKNMKSYYMIK